MLRTIYWYTHFAITVLWKTFDLYKLKKLKPIISERDFDIITEDITAKWAQAQIKASGAKADIHGLENIPKDEAVLFVSNHQGNFDIAFFMADIRKPKGFIAKTEVLKIPLLREWMENIHCLFINRNDIKQSAQTIMAGIELLKNGRSLVVFPEGTRSKGGPIGDFKSGSFKLATKSNAKIIPVTIDGSYRVMEANNNKIKPALVKITIHPPIDTKSLSKDEQSALPETVKSIIQTALA